MLENKLRRGTSMHDGSAALVCAQQLRKKGEKKTERFQSHKNRVYISSLQFQSDGFHLYNIRSDDTKTNFD